MSSASKLVPVPHRVPLCIWDSRSNSQGGWIPLWIKLSVGAWWDLLPAVWGMHPGDKGGDKSPSPQSHQWAPKKCCRNLKLRYRTLRQFSSLLCQHRYSGLLSKGWALRTKRSQFIHPCKQITEAKSKAHPTCGCMWLYWLCHFLSAMWPSCFNFLSFISLLCHPFTLSHCQNTAYLFLFWSSSLLQHFSIFHTHYGYMMDGTGHFRGGSWA
jgi:hypothetical protein